MQLNWYTSILQNDALIHTTSLQQEFENKIKDKDYELEKAKKALDAVMVEFTALQNRHTEQASLIKSLEQQRDAEIEIRRASEKDAALAKTKADQERAFHATLLHEIKAAHQNEITHLDHTYKEADGNYNALLHKLLEEKKQLGFEFSDKLMEIKTALYNQDVKVKYLENSLMDSQGECNKLALNLSKKIDEIVTIKLELTRLTEDQARKDSKLMRLKPETSSMRPQPKNCPLA